MFDPDQKQVKLSNYLNVNAPYLHNILSETAIEV